MTRRLSRGRGAAASRPVRVLLAAPLPPPPGGIAGWTERILAIPTPAGIDRQHVDTATRLLHHYAAPIGWRRIWRQGLVVGRFLWKLASARPDVVHITTSYDTAFLRDGLFVIFARVAGAAAILNIRGGDFGRFYSGLSGLKLRAARFVLRRCAAIVPVTAETRAFLQSSGFRRVEVVPNCIDVIARPPVATSSLHRWLFVGWVMPAKGISELLQALSRFPDATLTLAGPSVVQDGIAGADIVAAEGARLGVAERVHLIETLDHDAARNLYREHDLLVFPTHREGFPNVVLEAMEAGLPIVTTAVGAIPEMIRDGIDGLLVPPADAEALVAALDRLFRSPGLAGRLGASARGRVLHEFTVERVAARWCGVYARLMDDPHSWNDAPGPSGEEAGRTDWTGSGP